ncbi:MAG: methionyl-tRNA formyltransferase [Chloroflexota bacterium]
MRVVFMGTPAFAVPALRHLVLDRYQMVAVYTQPDRPAGRGRPAAPSPVKVAAQACGLPVVQPESLKEDGAAAQLAGFQPDTIVVAAFGQLLPRAVLEIPHLGCLNIHPSLLPRFRGASPVASAILAGDDFAGASIMMLDEGMDSGPLLSRAAVAVSMWDDTGSLSAKLAQVGAWLLTEVLERWARHEIVPRPQDEAEAIYCRPLAKEEGEIDWRLPAVTIWRRVRAFNPWPGCYTRLGGRLLRVLEALPLPAAQGVAVGQVVARDGSPAAFGVGTGDGVLGISKVQLEGRRAMTADEFLRGQRQFVGAVLPG